MFNDQQMNSIIRLSEAHTESDLVNTFLQELRELKLAEHPRYFQIQNPQRDRQYWDQDVGGALIHDPVNIFFKVTPINEYPHFMEAVENLEIVKVPPTEEHGGYSVVPVMDRLAATGLLVLDGIDRSREQWEFIFAVVEIIGNQLSLVRKKERDALTGLYNRLVFEQRLHHILSHTSREGGKGDKKGTGLCFAMIDIDHFKQVNDDLGHLFGDEVLVHFARIMNKSFRHIDLTCRYGGEEFAVVLRDVDLPGALIILERFRKAVERYPFPQIGTKTISIGLVQIGLGEIMTSIIDKADRALYYAKTHGRNQVQAYEKLVESGELTPHSAGNGDVELF